MIRTLAILLTLALALAAARAARDGEVRPGDFNPQVLYEAQPPRSTPVPAAAPTPYPTPAPFAAPTPYPALTPFPAPTPFGAPAPTSGTLAAEIEGIGEEICYLAVTNFEPGGAPAPGVPAAQPWTPTHLANAELGRILTEFAANAPLAEEEKVVRVVNEAVVAKGAAIGEIVRLGQTYNDIRTAINDHTAGPMTESEMDDLIGLLSAFLGPIPVRHAGIGFGAGDYCFKSVFETTERKFRLNVIRHGGAYLWFVEDVV